MEPNMTEIKDEEIKSVDKDGKIKFVEFELVEDLQDFIAASSDVQIEEDLKGEINKIILGTLVKVEMEIGSPTKIISVKEVDEDLIAREIN